MNITDDMLDRIEYELGMGSGAWDMVEPKEIIAASVRIAGAELIHAVKVAREVFNSRIDSEHCFAGPVDWADLRRAMDAALTSAQ